MSWATLGCFCFFKLFSLLVAVSFVCGIVYFLAQPFFSATLLVLLFSARLLTWLIDWLQVHVFVWMLFALVCLFVSYFYFYSARLKQLPLTARIMEWLQLQPISRQESGFVEEDLDQGQEIDEDQPSDAAIRRRFYDVTRRSLPTSVRSRSRFGRRWKFLSRKSSWRSL